MKIERSFDGSEILKAVDECFNDIVEDGTLKNSIDINVNKDCWMKVHDDAGTIGFFQFSPYNSSALKVHPFIFRDRRAKSRAAAELAKQWFNTESPENYQSLVTHTADYNRHVIIFLLRLGFMKVGVFLNAFRKDKSLYNIIHFQLMRAI